MFKNNHNYFFALHSSHLILSKMLFAVSGVLFWWIAAKLYSVESIGIGSVLISVSSLLVFMSSLGFNSTFVRVLPQDKERAKTVGTLFVFSLFLLILFGIVFILGVSFFPSKRQIFTSYPFAFVFLLLVVVMQIFGLLDGIYISLNLTSLVLIKGVIQNFLRIGVLFSLVYFGGFGIFSSNCLAAIFAIIVSFIFFIQKKPSFKIDFKPNFSILRKYLPFSLVNFLNALSFSLVGMIAPIVILFLYSKREAGLFYIPWMVFSTYCSFILSVNSVFLMEASYGENVKVLFRKALPLSFGLGMIGFLVFFFRSSYILSIFKKDFSVYSSGVLKVLFSSIFFFITNQTYITILNIRKEVVNVGKISIFILLGIVIFALLFMPKLKVIGIAYSWLFANLAGNIYIILGFVKRKYLNTA